MAESILDRLARIEARQRQARQHDPGCPGDQMTMAGWAECDPGCWLADPEGPP